MRTGSTGAATLRHVGLVALEALLVAVLVWIAAMTLAGAGQSDGIVGSAQAGRDPGTVSVRPTGHGQAAVVSTSRAPDGGWAHLTCSQGKATVLDRWGRLDRNGRSTIRLATEAWTSGGATCVVEIGFFTTSGRWRVDAATTFAAAG
jgi:hypothetical protein